LAASFAGIVIVACSSDAAKATTFTDAGLEAGIVDATLGGETAAPVADADLPPGDVCGDKGAYPPSAAWPVAGGCSTRAGYSLVETSHQPVSHIVAAFSGGSSAPVIAVDGSVWVGTADGLVVQIVNEAIARAYKTGGSIKGAPVIASDSTVIVGSNDGNLYGFDSTPASGDAGAGIAGIPLLHRRFAVPVGPVASSPVLGSDGTIYVATTDGKLSAVSPTTHAVAWSSPTDDTFGSSPAVAQNGDLFIASTDHSLHAFAPNGTAKWTKDLGAESHSSPAIGGEGSIYVGDQSGMLHAFDGTGNARWTYQAGGPVGSPSVYAGLVYAPSDDHRLHGVSTADGTPRYTYATSATAHSAVIAPSGDVTFGSEDGHIYVLTPKGGLFVAALAHGTILSAPAVATNGFVYFNTDKGLAILGN
jgi:outer membrane protein assembly factor BamB